MFYTTVVKVEAAGSSQPLASVRVELYDKDTFSKDDLLGSELTDAAGEARFRFTADQFDDEDRLLQRQFPDLYAVVLAPDGARVCTTRAETVDNVPRRHITVSVPIGAVRAHGWATAV